MARTPNRVSRNPKRTPVGGRRNILHANGLPEGFVGRWVNDVDNRIQTFLDAGYEFVTDKNVTVGDRGVDQESQVGTVRSKNVGGGTIAYLMAQRKEWYEEDQAEKQEFVTKREEEITKTKTEDGQYGGVSIHRG